MPKSLVEKTSLCTALILIESCRTKIAVPDSVPHPKPRLTPQLLLRAADLLSALVRSALEATDGAVCR
jgi:hypothetical protein